MHHELGPWRAAYDAGPVEVRFPQRNVAAGLAFALPISIAMWAGIFALFLSLQG